MMILDALTPIITNIEIDRCKLKSIFLTKCLGWRKAKLLDCLEYCAPQLQNISRISL